jgi:hypothetical protein
MQNSSTGPNILIKLLEKELLAFASDSNARQILSKYSITLPDDKMQKALVIWSTEFRHVLEKWRQSLPDDEVEAEAALERKRGSRGPRKSKVHEELELIDESELA